MTSNESRKQIDFWVGKLTELPALPSIVQETLKVTNDPNSSIPQISEIIGKDMSLSTRVLRLANSGFYAIPGGAKTIERAVTVLGMESIAQLVYTAAVFSHFELQSRPEFSLRAFWKHSLGVAMASESIARELGLKDPSMVYLAGLIHDIGKLVQFQLNNQTFLDTCKYAKSNQLTLLEAEKQLDQPSHDVIGHELVRIWRLPTLICEAVHHHHNSSILIAEVSPIAYPRHVGTVYLANLIVHSMRFGDSGHEIIRNPSVDVVKRVLGNEQILVHFIRTVKKTLEKVDPVLSIMLPSET